MCVCACVRIIGSERAIEELLHAFPGAAAVRCGGGVEGGEVGGQSPYAGSLALHLLCQGPAGSNISALKKLMHAHAEVCVCVCVCM